MEKKYVNIENNRQIDNFLNYFNIGDTVVIKDGSYMTDSQTNGSIEPMFYLKEKNINCIIKELFTITRVNIPFKTSYKNNSLGFHNNCEIEGFDGNKYHCSIINIINFK